MLGLKQLGGSVVVEDSSRYSKKQGNSFDHIRMCNKGQLAQNLAQVRSNLWMKVGFESETNPLIWFIDGLESMIDGFK